MRLFAIFGSIYIAVIFIFAFIYSRMDHAFYDDKIKQEIPFRQETIDISEAIFEALQRPPCQNGAAQQAPFCRRPETPVEIGPGAHASASNFNRNQIISAGDGVISLKGWFDIAVMPAGASQSAADDYVMGARIDFRQDDFFGRKRLAGYSFFGKKNDDELQFKPVVSADVAFDRPLNRNGEEPPLAPDELNRLFRYLAGNVLIAHVKSSDGPLYRINLYMPAPLAARMDRLIAAASGYTSELNDNFARMVYFSATTISTLGLGDIVPIQNPARWLVTAEAIIGAGLLGLFLNALANNGQRRTD